MLSLRPVGTWPPTETPAFAERLRQLRADGYLYREITDLLNQEAVPPPSGSRSSRWTFATTYDRARSPRGPRASEVKAPKPPKVRRPKLKLLRSPRSKTRPNKGSKQ